MEDVCVLAVCEHYAILYKGFEHPDSEERYPEVNPLWILRSDYS